jgi:hypothetical protein
MFHEPFPILHASDVERSVRARHSRARVLTD